MRKKYLRICNTSLLLFSPTVLASGLLLEYLHGSPYRGIPNTLWTWLHIIVSAVMALLVAWHVLLHWPRVNQWYRRFSTHRPAGLKYTALSYLLTIVTGVIVVPFWLHDGHLGLGGLHGKIGFVAACCILRHVLFKRRMKSEE